jgi:hypothetical protein
LKAERRRTMRRDLKIDETDGRDVRIPVGPAASISVGGFRCLSFDIKPPAVKIDKTNRRNPRAGTTPRRDRRPRRPRRKLGSFAPLCGPPRPPGRAARVGFVRAGIAPTSRPDAPAERPRRTPAAIWVLLKKEPRDPIMLEIRLAFS